MFKFKPNEGDLTKSIKLYPFLFLKTYKAQAILKVTFDLIFF